MKVEKRKTTTIIFDLDGTLVEFILDFKKIKKTIIDFLELMNLPIENLDSNMQTTNLISEMILILKDKGYSDEYVEKIQISIYDLIEIFEWEAAGKTNLLPDVEETLYKLKEKYELILFTNVPNRVAKYTLDRFNLMEVFSKIYGRDDVPSMKPHKEGIEYNIQKNDLDLEKTLMVGDSSIDIIPANKIGLFTVGITTGKSPKEVLTNSGAKKVLSSINELSELIEPI
ncbi:MAG: HAD family hydrolase [Candidatus Ranarchaeia archaeon]